MYHYIKYDVYRNDFYVRTTIGKFLSRKHATRCIDKWNSIGVNNGYLYVYIVPVNEHEYELAKERGYTIDHSGHNLHLA